MALAQNVPTPLPTLELVDLACRRGNQLLFEGVNFTVAQGEMVWLRGRNGCGKTSLLRVVVGLSQAERGAVLWGAESVRHSAAYGQQLMYIAHAHALKHDLTATETLDFWARVHGFEASPDALQRALETWGIAAWRAHPVRTLSQGLRRKLALARLALCHRPGLWVLDEPFDSLDTTGTQRLTTLMAAHQAQGGSVLLSSHLPFDHEHLKTRAFDLDRLK